MNIDISDIFKTLSDPTRLRILVLLTKGELCVCDITDILNLPQSTVSRHMSRLKLTGLVLDTRKGKWVFYKLNNHHDDYMIKIIEIIGAISIQDPFVIDLNNLENHDKCKKC